MNILEVLLSFYGEHQWVLKGDDYDSLEWDESNSIPKPSEEELSEKWEQNTSLIQNNEIQRQRQLEIVSIWPIEKQFEAITEFHMDRPEKLENLIAHIQSVKDKYPKN
jgi:hypothetical protein|tara:strand:- start:69 stop:392 length:324 start_codon:yes stop_codon:yes gene_type:complete